MLIKADHLGVKKPVFYDENSYTVMKSAGSQSLDEILYDGENVRELDLNKRFNLVEKLLDAICTQVSNKGIVHRDLKPNNILVDLSTDTCVVVDYGLAIDKKEASKYRQDGKGTPEYAPPDIYLKVNQDEKFDVFSMGVILAEAFG